MAANVKEVRKTYEDNLKPDAYNQTVVEAFQKMKPEFSACLQALHNTIKSGKYTGKRLLEIGSGSTVHNIASASFYFDEIIQSDLVDANCEELKKWIKGESELDWSEPLKVVAEIEGYSDLEKGVQEIASRVRKCVKNVVHCDVLSDHVIPEEAGRNFDLIISFLTLECASANFESFVDALKRLHDLLRLGGGLLLAGFLNGDNWQAGNSSFHYLRFNKHDIDRALDLANFGEIDWTLIQKKSEDCDYEYDQMYFLSSRAI